MINSTDIHEQKDHDHNLASIQKAHSLACTYIRIQQRESQWWPYLAKHREASTEATSWCALSLRDEHDTAKRAVEFLTATQNPDGGWSTAPGAGQSDWTSGPAVLALRVLAQQKDAGTPKARTAIQKALLYMCDSRTEFYGSLARLILFMLKGREGLSYARGWPWTHDCFHWIEPTVYALLSFNLPTVPEPELFKEIIARAQQFIAENQCQGGGWNHGSSFCLNVHLPPYIVTTAEALLAMQDASGDNPQTRGGLDFLQRTEPSECSAMERAWAILALNAYKKDCTSLLNALVQSQHPDGSFGVNLMVSALCTLALDTANGKNPLQMSRG